MARIGLKKALYNKIDPQTKNYADFETYEDVPRLEKIIDEKFAPEYNSAELYADDALAESDYSFKRGTLTITVADDDDKICAELLGNKESGIIGIAQNISDTAPEFGYGHVVTKLVNGVRKYKVEFFPRVRFTKITTDAKTRGESVEFGTTTLEAVVLPLVADLHVHKAGDWEVHDTFDEEQVAIEHLTDLMMPSGML